MKLTNGSQFNSTSRDAMTVAPYSCTANNGANIISITDIAMAMSFLLCLVLSIIGLISGISIIIILSIIILICGRQFGEKAVDNLA